MSEETISANGVRFHVHSAGQGEPALLFLHYFGGSGRTWEPVIEQMAGQCRCIAPDLRGWGDSEATETGYAVADMADDMAHLAAHMGLERYVLVGHSMGGKAAQMLAARRPAGLEALALIAPSPPTPEPMPDAERARLRAAYGSPDASRETLRQITASPLSAPDTEHVIQDNLRGARAAWLAWLDTGSREDISPQAAAIAAPTWVLAGGADKGLPPDTLEREVVARIAGAQMSVVPDAGHLLPLEAPDAVAAFLRRAMQSTSQKKKV